MKIAIQSFAKIKCAKPCSRSAVNFLKWPICVGLPEKDFKVRVVIENSPSGLERFSCKAKCQGFCPAS